MKKITFYKNGMARVPREYLSFLESNLTAVLVNCHEYQTAEYENGCGVVAFTRERFITFGKSELDQLKMMLSRKYLCQSLSQLNNVVDEAIKYNK